MIITAISNCQSNSRIVTSTKQNKQKWKTIEMKKCGKTALFVFSVVPWLTRPQGLERPNWYILAVSKVVGPTTMNLQVIPNEFEMNTGCLKLSELLKSCLFWVVLVDEIVGPNHPNLGRCSSTQGSSKTKFSNPSTNSPCVKEPGSELEQMLKKLQKMRPTPTPFSVFLMVKQLSAK